MRAAGSQKEKILQFVTIVTYGRSGSTLLQGILNAIPGACIRGENNNAFHSLYLFYCHLQATKKHGMAKEETDPWYGGPFIQLESTLKRLRALAIKDIFVVPQETEMCGFKEIRYSDAEVPNLEGYLNFLSRLFPNLKFIINLRSNTEVAKSGWWQKQADSLEIIARIERRFLDYSEKYSERCIIVRYEEYTSNVEALRPMFEFLDRPFDLNAIERILKIKHSY